MGKGAEGPEGATHLRGVTREVRGTSRCLKKQKPAWFVCQAGLQVDRFHVDLTDFIGESRGNLSGLPCVSSAM
jgi:hypothetical protein